MRFFSNTQEDNEILCFLDGIRTVAVVVILIVTTVVITLLPRKRIRAIRRAVAVWILTTIRRRIRRRDGVVRLVERIIIGAAAVVSIKRTRAALAIAIAVCVNGYVRCFVVIITARKRTRLRKRIRAADADIITVDRKTKRRKGGKKIAARNFLVWKRLKSCILKKWKGCVRCIAF